MQDSICAESVLVSYLETVHKKSYLDKEIKIILPMSVLVSNAGLYSSREGSPTRADLNVLSFCLS